MKAPHWMWVVVAAIYVLAFPYHPGLRSPNELCRLLQTRAIVEFGDLDLNSALRAYGPVGDLAVYRGRYYPSKAPLMSFAAVPVYLLARTIGGGGPTAVSELRMVYLSRLFLTVLPTLLLLIWMRRFLLAFVSQATTDATLLTYALGTLAFSYSELFMSHQPTAVLIFSAFYISWRWSRGERSQLALLVSGGLASAAIAAEYTTALCFCGLLLYIVLVLRSQRASVAAAFRVVALFVCGAIPLTTLLLWYHTRAFGGPLDTGYRHLVDLQYQPWHQGGFLGIGLPERRAFILSFFSPLRGLFVLSPGLLAAIPGTVLLFLRARSEVKLRPLAWMTSVIVLFYVYFTSSFSYDSWGWTTGPRHLTAMVPFLVLPLALAIDRLRLTWLRGPCGVVLAASVFITSALTFVNYIPDDVSNALLALSIPLTRAGDLSPSIFFVLGLSNPVAGLLLWLGVASVIGWLLWSLRPQPNLATWTATLVTMACLVAFQCGTYKSSAADRAALALLQRVWLTSADSSPLRLR